MFGKHRHFYGNRKIFIFILIPVLLAGVIWISNVKKNNKYNQKLPQAKKYKIFYAIREKGFYSIRGDGSEKRKIFNGQPQANPIMSPDKKYLLLDVRWENPDIEKAIKAKIKEKTNIYLYDFGTGKAKRLLQVTNKDVQAQWLPNNNLLIVDYSKPREFVIYKLPSLSKKIFKFNNEIQDLLTDEYGSINISEDCRYAVFNLHIKWTYKYEYLKAVCYDFKQKKIIESFDFKDEFGENFKFFDILSEKYKTHPYNEYLNYEPDENNENNKDILAVKIEGKKYTITNNPLVIKRPDGTKKEIIGFHEDLLNKLMREKYERFWLLTKDNKYLLFQDDSGLFSGEKMFIVDIKTQKVSKLGEADIIYGIR